MHKIYIKIILFFSLAVIQNLSTEEISLEPSLNSQEELQEALILINSGDTLRLSKGTYYFEDGLSLDVDNVTIEGAGMNETILNFSKQASGAQGLLVTSIFFAVGQNLFTSEIYLEPSLNTQEELQEALIVVKEGDTLKLGKGIYYFEDGLSLDVDNVTIEGAGMDDTILNFSKQASGAQGLLVTSNQVTLKEFLSRRC